MLFIANNMKSHRAAGNAAVWSGRILRLYAAASALLILSNLCDGAAAVGDARNKAEGPFNFTAACAWDECMMYV